MILIFQNVWIIVWESVREQIILVHVQKDVLKETNVLVSIIVCNDNIRTPPINARCHGIDPKCLSMPIIASQCQSILRISIERNWPELISIYRHWASICPLCTNWTVGGWVRIILNIVQIVKIVQNNGRSLMWFVYRYKVSNIKMKASENVYFNWKSLFFLKYCHFFAWAHQKFKIFGLKADNLCYMYIQKMKWLPLTCIPLCDVIAGMQTQQELNIRPLILVMEKALYLK